MIETSRPIAAVARSLGLNEGTLGNWVATYRREHAGQEPPVNHPMSGRGLPELKMKRRVYRRRAALHLNQIPTQN